MALSLPDRTTLGAFPTPLQRHESLGKTLGVAELWLKRDDLSGFAWGGNKVRTIEFLLADAMRRGATDLVVAGGPSSNFAATMAAAGRTVDIVVHQVAYGSEPTEHPPALRASIAAGARVTYTGSTERATMELVGNELADALSATGRTAIALPRGGATPLGTMGFVAAVSELHEQVQARDIQRPTIVVPVGSGGSITGILAGIALLDLDWPVIGGVVSRPPDETLRAMRTNAATTVAMLDPSRRLGDADHEVRLVDCRGDGFGLLTDDETSFGQVVFAATGLVLDATYNTKPLRWLAAHAPEFSGPTIYWLTGGVLGGPLLVSPTTATCAGTPTNQKDIIP